jgi:hypothetical protein
MDVRRISDPHTRRVGAVLEDLLRRNRAGQLPSLLFIAEETGKAQPLYGIVGRFKADPARAIGHLAIMKVKVTEYAADELPDIEH